MLTNNVDMEYNKVFSSKQAVLGYFGECSAIVQTSIHDNRFHQVEEFETSELKCMIIKPLKPQR